MIIGVDIGGTKIKTALIDGKKVKNNIQIKTDKDILKNLVEIINKLKDKDTKGIGIGIAGALNKERTKVLKSANISWLNGMQLKRILEQKTKLPVKLENDSMCFALGASIITGYKNLVGLIIGTGVGSGIVIDGNIFHGFSGSAGEVGHCIIKFDGRKCTCGNIGCLEEYISGRGIEKTAVQLDMNLRAREIEDLAYDGDKRAKAIYKEMGGYLGIGLANIVNTLSPEVIALGGGVSHAYKLFIKDATRTMNKNILSPLAKKVKIVYISDNNASIIGAASLFT